MNCKFLEIFLCKFPKIFLELQAIRKHTARLSIRTQSCSFFCHPGHVYGENRKISPFGQITAFLCPSGRCINLDQTTKEPNWITDKNE